MKTLITRSLPPGIQKFKSEYGEVSWQDWLNCEVVRLSKSKIKATIVKDKKTNCWTLARIDDFELPQEAL